MIFVSIEIFLFMCYVGTVRRHNTKLIDFTYRYICPLEGFIPGQTGDKLSTCPPSYPVTAAVLRMRPHSKQTWRCAEQALRLNLCVDSRYLHRFQLPGRSQAVVREGRRPDPRAAAEQRPLGTMSSTHRSTLHWGSPSGRYGMLTL